MMGQSLHAAQHKREKMKNKKGASAILAYVLLISLTVILAVSVTIYMKNKAKTQAEELTETVGTMLDCESVAINAYLEVNNVVVTNVGAKSVFLDLRYRTNAAGNPFIHQEDVGGSSIKPKPYGAGDAGDFKKIIPVADRLDKVEVIPKVVINKKKIGCIDKKVTVG